jgi:hypothetical protein
MRATVPLAAISIALASTLALTGCAAATGADSDLPEADAVPTAEHPCVVGTWTLDVADYAAQSEAYVLGLGLPIENFDLTGAGTITFTADGLVATDIDLRTTGDIVAADMRVPLDQRSVYTGSGDWATGSEAETIDLANWANLPDPGLPADPDAPPLPTIDYTDIPTVTALCTDEDLVLQGPDAPLSALWHR